MINNTPIVFVVDDEKIIAETLARILDLSGFAAKSFCNPVEALYAARSEAPDLLLSDVMMPQFSGIDLAIAIIKQCPECKVLLFSGAAGTLDLLSKARELGYDFRLLQKPLQPSVLLRCIGEQVPAWASVGGPS